MTKLYTNFPCIWKKWRKFVQNYGKSVKKRQDSIEKVARYLYNLTQGRDSYA